MTTQLPSRARPAGQKMFSTGSSQAVFCTTTSKTSSVRLYCVTQRQRLNQQWRDAQAALCRHELPVRQQWQGSCRSFGQQRTQCSPSRCTASWFRRAPGHQTAELMPTPVRHPQQHVLRIPQDPWGRVGWRVGGEGWGWGWVGGWVGGGLPILTQGFFFPIKPYRFVLALFFACRAALKLGPWPLTN